MPIVARWLLRFGPTNPIVVRLVQTGSRRTRHLYIRSVYLGSLIAVLLWALLVNARGDELSYQALAQAGSKSFAVIAFLQIALICVLAPVFMAGAIAQEADPRTWDILLSTPLSATEIVLGNLFGRLFFILALLFSSLPLFAVTQYFGGVPGSSIFASYLIAAAAALVVGAIAIALSVSRLVGRRAVFAFYVAVVSYLAVTWAADALLRSPGVTWMTALNPFLALTALLDPAGYPRAAAGTQTGLAAWFLERPVTTWCLLSIGVSVGLIGVSTVTVRVGGLAGLGGLRGRAGGVPWYRRLFGLGAAGAETRPARTVWHNPIAWREAAARNATLGRITARWSFIVLGGALAVGLLWMYHTQAMGPGTFRTVLLYTVTGQIAVISLVAINMSATAVSREREDGTLDLLLTTPITPGQYLSGKLKGIVAYLLPMIAVPMFTAAIAGAYAAFGGFGRADGAELAGNVMVGAALSAPVVLPESVLVLPLVCVPFVAFCVVVGMAMSLRSQGTIASVMATVGIIGAVGGTIGLCAWNAAGSIASIGPALGAMSPASAVFACVEPERAMLQTVTSATAGLSGARASLFVGALVAAGVYSAVVWGVHGQMTRTFDMTVRRLAGTR
ncbi:MAG: ABC transporter permease subunit [Phycisphaeraceae bacterium]|nr:ABC transporter permease subunit [Phycisphaeraceae bacterium]